MLPIGTSLLVTGTAEVTAPAPAPPPLLVVLGMGELRLSLLLTASWEATTVASEEYPTPAEACTTVTVFWTTTTSVTPLMTVVYVVVPPEFPELGSVTPIVDPDMTIRGSIQGREVSCVVKGESSPAARRTRRLRNCVGTFLRGTGSGLVKIVLTIQHYVGLHMYVAIYHSLATQESSATGFRIDGTSTSKDARQRSVGRGHGNCRHIGHTVDRRRSPLCCYQKSLNLSLCVHVDV